MYVCCQGRVREECFQSSTSAKQTVLFTVIIHVQTCCFSRGGYVQVHALCATHSAAVKLQLVLQVLLVVTHTWARTAGSLYPQAAALHGSHLSSARTAAVTSTPAAIGRGPSLHNTWHAIACWHASCCTLSHRLLACRFCWDYVSLYIQSQRATLCVRIQWQRQLAVTGCHIKSVQLFCTSWYRADHLLP